MINFDIISIVQAAEEAVHTPAAPGIASMFGISWKLFLAQLVNFCIVLIVLWKWVFTPVTAALQKRAEKIEHSLRTAEKIEHEKSAFTKWKTAEIHKVKLEAAEIVSQARQEAEAVKQEVLVKSKQDQEKILQDGKLELKHAEAQMLQEAKNKLAGLVVSAAEKVLGEKLTDKKDLEMARRAIEEMQ